MHFVGIAELDPEKARQACLKTGWPAEALVFGDLHRGHRGWRGKGQDRDHGRRLAAYQSPAGRYPGDYRRAGGRRSACLASPGKRQTRGHGERRGRRPAGTHPRGQGRAVGVGLFHGLRRPARAHRGTDRLGARRGPGGGLRRQGHALPARVPLFHAGDGLGPLRFLGGARGLGRLQRQDVQLFSGRDEVGDRDVRRVQRQRA